MAIHTFFTLLYVCAMPSMILLLLVGIAVLCKISPRFDRALMRCFDYLTK